MSKTNGKANPGFGLSAFRLTDEEWLKLDKKFGKLCKFAAWQLLRNNLKNSHTDDLEDIDQELRKAVIIAGMYTKRQSYIEACLSVVQQFCKDEFMKRLVDELEDLWKNRKKHGANKQKFGVTQEKLLHSLVQQYVPAQFRPSLDAPLKIDRRFAKYCKSVTWNNKKTMGRKITKERSLRNGMVSFSNFDYLQESNSDLATLD